MGNLPEPRRFSYSAVSEGSRRPMFCHSALTFPRKGREAGSLQGSDFSTWRQPALAVCRIAAVIDITFANKIWDKALTRCLWPPFGKKSPIWYLLQSVNELEHTFWFQKEVLRWAKSFLPSALKIPQYDTHIITILFLTHFTFGAKPQSQCLLPILSK